MAIAQNNRNTAFAIVNNASGRTGWMNITEIDFSSGQVTRNIFDKENTPFTLLDAATKKPFKEKIAKNTKEGLAYESPTATMVAATAYDKRHDKLFFTPMRFGELRWIDLSEKGGAVKVYCLRDQLLTVAESRNEGSQITRMTIAADGNGYALTNDGMLTTFTTGKKVAVTQLGQLKDDPQNKANSILVRQNWGGDMIADAFGNLYVFSSTAAVFKIDLHTKIATYLGSLKGLPANYTTNGAAVDPNGDIIVSCAYSKDGYFKVNLSTLDVTRIDIQTEAFATSDLASGNLAFQKQVNELSGATLRPLALGKSISLYPNPVTAGNFKLNFTNHPKGSYDIEIADLTGKVLLRKNPNVTMNNQTETVLLDSRLSKGMYLIKIIDSSKKMVSSGNILLQ